VTEFDPNEYSDAELDMMGQFANQFAFGMPLGQALLAAGYGTRNAAKAYELLRKPYVQGIINETREWIKGQLADNVQTLLQQLDQDREFAYKMENPAAAVSATNAKAKLMGLLDPQGDGKTPKKITIVWDDKEEST
jgi:hypothetical protein